MASVKVIVFVAGLVACFFVSTNSEPAIAIDECICLEGKVQEAGDAQWTIVGVIDKLLENTASHGYNYKLDEALGDGHCWGNAACNGVISAFDCQHCLNLAKEYLFQKCSFSPGGHIKLRDCRLRFEPYEFHGDW